MFHNGIRGVAFDWFRSYLSAREQFTGLGSATSSRQIISCGVPQGSILGPLLFLLYINDIVRSCHKSNLVLFADDTNLLIEHTDFKELINLASIEIQQISHWFQINKLSLNIDKTQFMIFGTPRRQIPFEPTIAINNKQVERVRVIKFLGVYIDDLLNWKFHIRDKSKIISRNLGILHRIKNCVPLNIRKTLYQSLIHTHLTYGISAWGNSHSKEMKSLRLLQKKAVRFISNSKYNAHCYPIFSRLGILTVNDLFHIESCKIYLKSQKNKLPQYHSKQFTRAADTHNYPTRQRDDLRPPTTIHGIQNQLLSVKVAKVWNPLPDSIKQQSTKSVKSFCNRYHQHLISKYPTVCTINNCPSCLS